MIITKFALFENKISSLSELKSGHVITYKGSKYKVINVDNFIAKLKSIDSNDEISISQGQLDDSSVYLLD